MWEEAYISLSKYAELYNDFYKGINLVNATGYVPDSSYAALRVAHTGYASGTPNATPGLHRVDELGAEFVFTSANGKRYRHFTGGEMVLNPNASAFLYNFAEAGGKMFHGPSGTVGSISALKSIGGNVGAINMGDIIINGNANDRTVSEIRRAQRDSVDFMLKELNRLNK